MTYQYYLDSPPNSRPTSNSSRSSIIRSSRDNFVPEMQLLPAENIEESANLFTEEVLDIDPCENEGFEESQGKKIPDKKFQEEVQRNEPEEELQEELDPKIKKGLRRIQKLDKILAEKIEREKESKKERRALEQQFYQQVQELVKEKGLEKICGVQQLLSIANPIDKDDENHDENLEPFFTTQLHTDFYLDTKEQGTADKSKSKSSCAKSASKKQKNYIKRNIQLASHASEVIPLTELERKRLDELLADDSDLLFVENPFSAPVIESNGFTFSVEHQKTLNDIDAKLKELLPEEVYSNAIGQTCSDSVNVEGPMNARSISSVSGGTISSDSGINEEPVQCGEKDLQDMLDHRSMMEKLDKIETQLYNLQLQNDENGSLVDPDILRRLLDIDSRLTSSGSICDGSKSELSDVLDMRSVDSLSVTGLDTSFQSTIS